MEYVVSHIQKIKKDSTREYPRRYDPSILHRADRRKNKQDRRCSVREGVFVSFTGKDDDRRSLRDRRKCIS